MVRFHVKAAFPPLTKPQSPAEQEAVSVSHCTVAFVWNKAYPAGNETDIRQHSGRSLVTVRCTENSQHIRSYNFALDWYASVTRSVALTEISVRTFGYEGRGEEDKRLKNLHSEKIHEMCFSPNINLLFIILTQQPPVDHGLVIHEVSRSHTTTHHSRYDSSGQVISSSQRTLTTHNIQK